MADVLLAARRRRDGLDASGSGTLPDANTLRCIVYFLPALV
ncbi:MAG TPA: hypothetical protein VFN87_21540 [Solirubrobacteraceae bacterium]|nr:hypothetical protein [Solirubrobacteraceae bacterium]